MRSAAIGPDDARHAGRRTPASRGVLVLPGSPTTSAVSKLMFVAQGFLIHWLWLYLVCRKTRRASVMAVPFATAYSLTLAYPISRNEGDFNICFLYLPSKSAIWLFAALVPVLWSALAV